MPRAATDPSSPGGLRPLRRGASILVALLLAVPGSPAQAAEPDGGPLPPASPTTSAPAAGTSSAEASSVSRTDDLGAISWRVVGDWEELGDLESAVAGRLLSALSGGQQAGHEVELVAAYRHAERGFLGLQGSELFVLRVSRPGEALAARDFRSHAAQSRAAYENIFQQGGGLAPKRERSTFEVEKENWSVTTDLRFGKGGRREFRHDVMTSAGLYVFSFSIRAASVDQTESDVKALVESIRVDPKFAPASPWSGISWQDPPALGAMIGALLGALAMAGESILRRRRIAAGGAAGSISAPTSDAKA
jgi:hypothetical protein